MGPDWLYSFLLRFSRLRPLETLCCRDDPGISCYKCLRQPSASRPDAIRPLVRPTPPPFYRASNSVRSNVVVSSLSASRKVTATTAPVSRSTACSALWARCVRPSFIFVIRASRSVGLIHSLFEVRFFLLSSALPPRPPASSHPPPPACPFSKPPSASKPSHPADHLPVRLHIDRPPCPRNRRMIRR